MVMMMTMILNLNMINKIAREPYSVGALVLVRARPHKCRQNAFSKIGIFFIGAMQVSGYQTAHWRCQKWIARGKTTLGIVHSLLFMGCPSSQGFIVHNVNVSVQRSIIAESVLWNGVDSWIDGLLYFFLLIQSSLNFKAIKNLTKYLEMWYWRLR